MRRQLKAEGWLAGHEEYKTAENQQLHGGATRGPEGWVWLKNGTILNIDVKRMDDPVAGEDPATAGEWIQFIDLWTEAGFPGANSWSFSRRSSGLPSSAEASKIAGFTRGKPMAKRILFTGGTGKAGRHALPWLLDKGYEILTVDLQRFDHPGINTLIADITDSGQMFNAMTTHFGFGGYEAGHPPRPVDAVVHFAAIPRVLIEPDN